MGWIQHTYDQFEALVTETEKRIGNNASSIVYIFLAMLTYIVMVGWAKLNIDYISPVQTQFFRGLFITIFIYFYTSYKGISLTAPSKRYEILRIVRNIMASTFNVASFFIIEKIPVSTVMIIQATAPFMIAFLDHIFYKTTYTKVETIFSFVSLFGVIFLIKPDLFFDIQISANTGYSEGFERIAWISFYIFVTLFWSGSVIILRELKCMDAMCINFPQGICLAASSSIVEMFYIHIKNCPWWIYLQVPIVIGVMTFINQHTYIKANQMGKPAKVAILTNLNVVFAFLFEILALGERKELYSVIGALLIVGSSVILSISRL